MIEAMLSFLGGTAFRLIFGSVMDWLNKRQDHQNEMDLQRLQSELEAARHTRDLERIRLQSDLKVTEVKVMGDVEEQKTMADAFLEAVRATSVKTGVAFVDAWNASIRPAGASLSLVFWIGTIVSASFVLTDFDRGLIATFLGVFVGDRIHTGAKK